MKILNTINTNVGSINNYENRITSPLVPKLFEIVNNMKQSQESNAIKKKPMYRGHMPSSQIQHLPFNSYTEDELIEKGTRVQEVTKNGKIYFFDTETIGQPQAFNSPKDIASEKIKKLDEANNRIFTINEFAMFEAEYKDGVLIGEPRNVTELEYAVSRSPEEMRAYVNSVKNISESNSTTKSTFKRMAGYAGVDTFNDNRLIENFDNYADITDLTNVEAGIWNLGTNATRYGSEDHKGKVRSMLKKIGEIKKEGHLISALNGDAFDVDVIIQDAINVLGEDEVAPFIPDIKGSHVDFQKLYGMTMRDKIYAAQEKTRQKMIVESDILRKQGKIAEADEMLGKANAIKNTMTNTDIGHAANAKGANVDVNGEKAHLATQDTKNTAKGVSAFIPEFNEKIDSIKAEQKAGKVNGPTILEATNAVLAQEGDITFSTEFGNLNTYNPVIMEAGHSYSLTSYGVDDIDELKKLDPALAEAFAENKNRRLIEFSDISDKTDRKAYMFVDSDKELQEKIYDTGNVAIHKKNDKNIELAKKATDNAMIDKIRVEKENFGKVNSDKGFRSFEMYQDIFNDLQDNTKGSNTEALLDSALKTGIFPTFGTGVNVDIEEALPRLTSKKNGEVLVNERVRNLLGFYKDFDQNRNTYGRTRDAINTIVGDKNAIMANFNLPSENQASAVSNRLKTMAYAMYNKELDEKILGSVTNESKVLDYIAENHAEYKIDLEERLKKVREAVFEKEKKNGSSKYKSPDEVKLYKKTVDNIKKHSYNKVMGEQFDLKSENVKGFILGREMRGEDSRSLSAIDILNSDGEYTKLQLSNRSKFESQLAQNVYKNRASNGRAGANTMQRKAYIQKVSQDLLDRGLITADVFEDVNSLTEVAAKISTLSNGIHDNYNKVTTLITSNSRYSDKVTAMSNINYSKFSEEEAKIVKSFMENKTMNKISHKPNGNLVLGESYDNYLKRTFGNNGVEKLHNEITSSVMEKMPNLLTLSSTLNASTDSLLKEKLMREFGWSESNVDGFMDVIKNPKNDEFVYSNGKEVKGGLSHQIIDVDGEGYLITTPKDKERMVIDSIIKGESLDELKKKGSVFHLPKVHDMNGVKAIKQGEKSYKAITQDIIMVSKNGDVTFALEDSVDQMMNNLKIKMGYAKNKMQNRDMKGANSAVNGAWKVVQEEKTLSAVSARAIPANNKMGYVIEKTVGTSRADRALSGLVNIGDLVYSLDTVLEDNEGLAESLISRYSSGGYDEVANLKRRIANAKGDIYNKASHINFEGLDLNTKAWMIDNVGEISDTILKNEGVMNRIGHDPTLISMLEKIRDTGIKGFYTKESGETSKGFYNYLYNPEVVNAGSRVSGTSRPLISQTLAAPDINESSMKTLALNRLPKNVAESINSGSSVFDAIGVTQGLSFLTEDNVSTEIAANKLAGNSSLGFSTKVKYSSPIEFIDTINRYSEMDDSDPVMKKILENLKANGVTASSGEIRQAALDYGVATSLYEDSGAVDPYLAMTQSPKAVVEQKIDIDHSGFKVGNNLATGDIIGFENGRPVKYTGQGGVIVNSKEGLLTLQLTQGYNDFKAGLGGSEKLELHVPTVKNKRHASILHEVFQSMSGGANIIANPDVAKHEGFNTIFSAYSNAITNNIQGQTDVDMINKVFKESFTNQHMYIQKMDTGRYSLIEGKRVEGAHFNYIEDMNKVMNKLSSGNSTFSKNLAKEIRQIEKDRISTLDIVTMQDNTIEKMKLGVDNGGGASINHRSQNVMGFHVGVEDDITEYAKYRQIVDGKMATNLDAVIRKDILELTRNKKFTVGMEQVHNIRSTLSLITNTEIPDNLNIVNMDIRNALVPGGVMDAQSLPDVFKMHNNGERVHAYKIDLGKSNIKLENPLWRELIEKGVEGENLIIANKIDKYVSDLYIPALDSNWIKDEYSLTNTQKKASDLINRINDFSNGTSGRAYSTDVKMIHQSYKDYLESLSYELSDKNGIFKRSMKVKAEFSGRQKIANVVAPVVNEDGTYKDKFFGKHASRLNKETGQIEHFGVAVYNEEYMFQGNSKENFTKIGKQLVDENIDNSEEALAMIKRRFGNHKGISSAKDMAEAKKILQAAKLNDESYMNLGRGLLEEVGILGVVMRDPAMLPTSYQPVRMFTNSAMSVGAVAVDAVTARHMNADGDGDELNSFFHAFEQEKDGGMKLRQETDEAMMSIKRAMNANSIDNAKLLKNEAVGFLGKEISKDMTLHTLENYNKYIAEAKKEFFNLKDGVLNIDYMVDGGTKHAAILSRITKAAIGQVSNPNHYLRSAMTSYYAHDMSNEAIRSIRGINQFTTISEQKLIDVKSIKGIEEAGAMADVASSYRANMDRMGSLGSSMEAKNGRYNAVRDMYDKMLFTAEGGEKSLFSLGQDASVLLPENREAYLDDVAERIVTGKTIKGTAAKSTLEEVMGDMYSILQDKDANKVFFSPFVRQSDIKTADKGKLSMFERLVRGTESNTGGRDLFEQTLDKRYLYNNATIKFGRGGGESTLNVGDKIFKGSTDGTAPGVFEVSKSGYINDLATVELRDVNTDEIIKVSDSNFETLSNKMDAFRKYNNVDNKTDDEVNSILTKVSTDASKKDYMDKYTSNIDELLDGVSGLESLDKKSIEFKAKSSVLDSINIENTKDTLATAKVLRDKKLITEDESTAFIRSMNENIKKKGTAEYRQAKKEKLLNIKSLKKNNKVTSASIDSFINENVTDEDIQKVLSRSADEATTGRARALSRVNTDNVTSDIKNKVGGIISSDADGAYEKIDIDVKTKATNDTIDDIIKKTKAKDAAILSEIQQIYGKHSGNLDFQRDVLNWQMDEVKGFIADNKNVDAMKALNSSKVAYGKYAGMNFENLNTKQINSILTSEYFDASSKGGVSDDVINKTRIMIENINNLEKSGVHREISSQGMLNTAESVMGDDFIGEAREQLNKNIRKRAAASKGKFSGAGAKISDSLSTMWKSMSKGQKGIAAGIAAVAGVGLGIWSNSPSDIGDSKGDYVKPSSGGDIKNSEPTLGSQGHYQTPRSDTRFYERQHNGANINVKGTPPPNATPEDTGDIMRSMLGKNGLNINTNYNDTRVPIKDSDVDNMMSNSTRY